MIRHTLVCGASRSGKSEAELSKLLSLVLQGQCSVCLLDPHGPLAQKFLLHLALHGQLKRVIYDRLQDTDKTPCYQWLVRSTHPDLLQRAAEDEERIREFVGVLLRRRSNIDIKNSPVIERGLITALKLFMYQKIPVPLYWLPDVFQPMSPIYFQMVENCDNEEAVRQMKQWASLPPSQFDYHTGPAHRILEPILKSPAFMVRSGRPTFDLDSFLENNGILILDGSSEGNLSRDSSSIMMGSTSLQVIAHHRTKHTGKTVLVMDEAVNASLVGLPESQALAECGKWGLEFHILVQALNFPSKEIIDNVLQNCWRHEWFRQGSPEAAKLAAEDIGTATLDQYKIHHYDEHTRSADAGYQMINTTGRSYQMDKMGHIEGITRSHNVAQRHLTKEVKEKTARYQQLNDQITLKQQELMTLGPGWRHVRDTVSTTEPEYVPMLKEPWGCLPGLPEKKFQKALALLKESAVYRTPVIEYPVSTQPTDTGSAADRLRKKGTK